MNTTAEVRGRGTDRVIEMCQKHGAAPPVFQEKQGFCVVMNCATKPTFQEPMRDPARFEWHEVSKVQHYWLEVNAMTKPMTAREGKSRYER